MNDVLTNEPWFNKTLDAMRQTVLSEEASILLYNKDEDALIFTISASPLKKKLVGQRVELKHGLVSYVYLNQEAITVNDVKADPRHYDGVDKNVGSDSQQLMAIPITSEKYQYGVMTAFNCLDIDGFRAKHLQHGLEVAKRIADHLDELEIPFEPR